MESAKLILDYIKTLIWPVILISILFSYEKEVLNLLENREFEAFGLRVGQRIENISQTYEEEITELKDALKDRSNNEELLSKIEDIDINIKKELSNIQQQTIAPNLLDEKESTRSLVVSAERKGFEAILDRDVESALSHFSQARVLWSDYHNVSEIERVLKQRKNILVSELEWNNLQKLILQKYSWGMPKDIRVRFKA